MCYYMGTMKLLDRFKKLRLGQKTMIIIAILIVGVGGWITYDNVRPRPLGDKMVYLGKEDYRNIFGFDYLPASIYYYGTDLNIEDIPLYFKKSILLQKPFSENGKATINLQTPSGETIYIYHYASSDLSLFNTKKTYVIEIPSFKYQIALDSL